MDDVTFWTAVGASAAVATAASTLLILGFGAIIRYWRRPQVQWAVTGNAGTLPATDSQPARYGFIGTIRNVGDAPAYHVVIWRRRSPDVDGWWEFAEAMVGPGESVDATFSFAPKHCETLELFVSYRAQPTALGSHRTHNLRLGELLPKPGDRGTIALPAPHRNVEFDD